MYNWISYYNSLSSLSPFGGFFHRALSIPRPKEETLSKHSILGPNGLRGQWQPPSNYKVVRKSPAVFRYIEADNYLIYYISAGSVSKLCGLHCSSDPRVNKFQNHKSYFFPYLCTCRNSLFDFQNFSCDS